MLGLMQDWPLLCHRIIEHAARIHGNQEVVTRSVEGPIVRTTYAQIHQRALKVSQMLDRAGIKLGDRVATIAWNTARHLECWYGIMGIGAICHTVNPRLFPDQIAWIVNHAQDRVMITDLTFIPVLEKIADQIPSVERFVVLTDAEHMPQTTLKNAIAYEEWLKEADGDFEWKTFDENTAAAMCYTSGTTGDPKGVLYSHRSNVLHALMANNPDALGTRAADTMLPVVPLFHANSWGIAFSAPSMGTKLVMPGAKLDGASVYELLSTEKVTHTAGVPTVWLMLLQYMQKEKLTLPHLKMVVCGGSAMPRSMIKAFVDMGAEARHAWGMTEMSPLGTLATLKPPFDQTTGDARLDVLATQGYPPFGVQMKITDDAGKDVDWDGKTFGRLKVSGPAIAKAYYRVDKEILDDAGFFDTGDVATIDQDGYMRITDRSKDVIKSGGEWISSIDLENLAVGHPKVAEAAVIGVYHPKWDERPLLICQLKPDVTCTRDEILQYMDGKIAKWWMPDDIVFVEAIPHTATGKILKTALRDQFKTYTLPGAAA
ncbi:fatty-acid--CoA ligase [Rhodopseudomonas palustris]|uniref:3-methylmercaptopropionyl-CoA ligase n=1 Tax=Rhodopseudomonas palustris (strain ATCC BAA-98 / CGA009) TaxID=258594 RepID=Q6N1G3_RHOPA|nr:fatty-acid--CoA ligase [Rhodopseudomonas palustris]OPF96025.1 long-chain fatty acid--CoA ligase [Rhodopseudomonas palustris]PPQ41940.1 long-chain fatty acid--CoA ligase [Rhodopseudomonas palustris]QLH73385.1 fatty-acid--CoA ligase [Rhodopseudomonas palustris]QQM06012.1 3-methylmercaptopropionyl-CoA ligase [Rhodopseudomonas palustris]RIA02358.1 fatty-acid--CoA ligase [Rhodopseudomonas palustris]